MGCKNIYINYKTNRLRRTVRNTNQSSSSNIISVLNSIIYQISRIYNISSLSSFINNLATLKKHLLAQFVKIERLYPNKKLVIILDSIDQLDPSDYSLEWFIESFPSNIKIIFSTLSNHGHILQKIQSMEFFRQKMENFLEIKSLDKSLSITILKDWLTKENRNISQKQWEAILQ